MVEDLITIITHGMFHVMRSHKQKEVIEYSKNTLKEDVRKQVMLNHETNKIPLVNKDEMV